MPRQPRLDAAALSLYAIFGPQDVPPETSALALAEAVLRGGATCLQWRDKSPNARAPLSTRLEACAPVQTAARAVGVPLLINDDVDLAAALHADGVHLGQDDLEPQAARSRLGNDAIIGWSIGNAEERSRLLALQSKTPGVVDYIGVGPAYATATKTDAGEALGPEGIAELIRGLDLPAVAIGGIDRTRLPDLAATGVAGIAVISALTRSPDPAAEAAALLHLWQSNDTN